jgi:rSAM/selenodomain-associated transferase 2
MRCKADLFQNVEWGSARVAEQTKRTARALGLSLTCLPPLNDMDTASDLMAGLPDHEWQGPYLSVIIPTLNEAPSIGDVIHRARFPGCEVIVADGGSTDATLDIARASGAVVISAPRGRALQQNAGAARAQGKVLMFLHADTFLPSDYPYQVFETLMDHRVVAGAFQFKTDYSHKGMRLIEKTVRIRSTLFQMPYGDQALFMPKTIFQKAGGFPLAPIAEDLFLIRQLRRRGRIGMAPGAAVTSARRWRQIGIWRATGINYLIAMGCLAGINPEKLAPLYRLKK